MTSPAPLYVIDQPATEKTGGEAPIVVLVHGSLDRAASFRRVMRRLGELRVLAYDRRGYQRSRGAGVAPDFDGHIDDLLAVIRATGTEGPVSAVGHSLGGAVVLGAAVRAPDVFASVGAYEPPMPWLGFRRAVAGDGPTADGQASGWRAIEDDPAVEAENFFRRMVGDAAWERLPEQGRADRRADGLALVSELRALRADAPFDIMDLSVPSVIGRGGDASYTHHRETVGWLATHVPDAELFEIPGASHGAHLSHPGAFAQLVRRVVARGAERREHPMSAEAD